MISLAPLLETGLDIEIGEASQTRDVPDALGIRPMASITGDDVGFGNAIHEDRSSARGEAAVAVIGGLRLNRGKVVCQFVSRGRSERRNRAPHILLREGVVSRVFAETPDLTHNVLRPLTGKPRRDRIALRACSVTPGAIADGGGLFGPGGGNNGGDHRHDHY